MGGFNKHNVKWTYKACYDEALKYTSRGDFKKGCVGAYDKSRNMGWIDEYTWFAPVSNKKYTYDEVKAIADGCSTLAEFTKNHVGAYEAALKNGWLKDFTNLKRNNSYTPESIIEMCKNFSCASELIKSNQSAYNAFLKFYKNGDITDADIPWEAYTRQSWDHDSCYNEAKKYTSSYGFSKGNNSAYNKARKEGWFTEYTWFKNPRKVYTYDVCKELASRCESKGKFQKLSSSAYNASLKNGWLKDFEFSEKKKVYSLEYVIEECKKHKTKKSLCADMPGVYGAYLKFKRKGQLTDEEIGWETPARGNGDPEARVHFIYVYDFGNNVAYVGRTTDPKKRDSRHRIPHRSHHGTKAQAILQYSIDTGMEIPDMVILESELNMAESRRQEAYWCNHYKENGYTLLNTGAVGEFSGSVGSFAYKWTKDEVIEFAKRFKSISEMAKANRQAARMLNVYELADELFPNRQKKNAYTYEEAKDAASQCKTKYQLNKKFPKIYNACLSKGWLDEFFPKNQSGR